MGVPLNVDVAGSISELRDALKDFELRLKMYRVLFQGKGLDFDGYKEYTPEDDASLIDWKSTVRANKMLVKQYREEQDMKILFVMDTGEHMLTGSAKRLKAEYAVEAMGALMHLVLKAGDKIGLITFNDKVTNVLMPKRGNNHFDAIIDTLSNSSNYHGSSNIAGAIEFLIDYIDPSIKAVVIVSDFITLKPAVLKRLQIVGTKFETLAVMIKDPLDINLPDVHGEIVLENPVNGEQILVNPKVARNAYASFAKAQEDVVLSLFKQSGIDVIKMSTDTSFVPELAEFLKERVRQRKVL